MEFISRVSETLTKEAKEAAGIIKGYDFRIWLTPFVASRKTKSDISDKVTLS